MPLSVLGESEPRISAVKILPNVQSQTEADALLPGFECQTYKVVRYK